MKGNPRFEIFLLAIVGMLLIYPLQVLTRASVETAHVHKDPPTVETKRVNAWIDLRFSAAPQRIEVFQGDQSLWQGGGDQRDDGDLEIMLTHNQAQLRLELVWPDEVEDAYVECVLEVEAYKDLRKGFWSEGRDEKIWNLRWEDLP
ncbi:hypothetical protein P0Y35_08365 [Kiritimatiellaeota bacterium B1221]|nr:hypothetical protein [Kiritimatiellaeota bacterium B1221]